MNGCQMNKNNKVSINVDNKEESHTIRMDENLKTIDVNIEKNQSKNIVLFGGSNYFDASINIVLHENAEIVLYLVICGLVNKIDLVTRLEGECSNLIVNALSLADKSNHDISFNVFHDACSSSSNILVSSIASNESTVNIDLGVSISKGMKKSKTNQKIKGSVLDEKSRIEANPTLSVDEFDVEAEHSAAIGMIDENALFYMMSRGITKKDAQKMLLNSVLMPFLNGISDEKIKNEILKKL